MEHYLNDINAKIRENVFPRKAVYTLLNSLEKYTPKQQKRILVQINEVYHRFPDDMENLDVVHILEQRLRKVQGEIDDNIESFTVSMYKSKIKKRDQLLRK